MAVRTKRLGGGSFNTTTTTLYTCPANETAIVKYLTLHNPSTTSAAVVTLRAVVSGSPRTFARETLAANEARRYDLWLVLMAGESITGVEDVASNNVAWTMSGTELEGVAD